MDSSSNDSSKEIKAKRQCLNYQSREITYKVVKFLEEESAELLKIVSNPLYHVSPVLITIFNERLRAVRSRSAQAVGISVRTISNIIKEKEKCGDFMSPLKYRKKRSLKLELTDDNVNFIRSTIKTYQSKNKKSPSIKILYSIMQEKLNYKGRINTLRKSLLKLGYKWHMKNGRSELMDISSKIKTENNGDQNVREISGVENSTNKDEKLENGMFEIIDFSSKIKTENLEDPNDGDISEVQNSTNKKEQLNDISMQEIKKQIDPHIYIEIEHTNSSQHNDDSFSLKHEIIDPTYTEEISYQSISSEFASPGPQLKEIPEVINVKSELPMTEDEFRSDFF